MTPTSGRFSSLVLSSVFALLLSACGGDQFEAYEAASSEQVVQTSEYPMVVFIALPEGAGLCSGTFVSKRSVLTAAHCTQEAGTYTIFTSFGTFSTTEVMNLTTGQLNDPSDLAMLVLDHDAAIWDAGQIAFIGEPAVQREKLTLVGFGCDSLKTRLGAGRKRLGQNFVAGLDEYIELLTPASSQASKGVLGPKNRAGSCFGDSGGPLLRMRGGKPEVVGVSHSGGYRGSDIVSRYTNLHYGSNLRFLEDAATRYGLDITPACASGHCNQPAMTGITDFLARVWNAVRTAVAAAFKF